MWASPPWRRKWGGKVKMKERAQAVGNKGHQKGRGYRYTWGYWSEGQGQMWALGVRPGKRPGLQIQEFWGRAAADFIVCRTMSICIVANTSRRMCHRHAVLLRHATALRNKEDWGSRLFSALPPLLHLCLLHSVK